MIAVDPKHRVISGGSYKDFDTIEQAINYLRKKLKIFKYGSINKVYTFKHENKDTIQDSYL